MTCVETLQDMNTETSRREAVGKIVRGEVKGRRWSGVEAAEKLLVSLPTLNRLYIGDISIQADTLSAIEFNLPLPRQLLSHVINGDRAWVEALPLDPSRNFDADLKRLFLEAFDEPAAAKTRARQVGR